MGHLVPVPDLLDRGGHHHAKVASICANHYGTDRFASAYQKGSFRCDVLTAWAMQTPDIVDADYMNPPSTCRR